MTARPSMPELSIAFAIYIGRYRLEPSERHGYVWITYEGEGGEFEAAKLEEALAKCYAENY